MQKFKEGATNCNAYVLFEELSSVQLALDKNQATLKGRHLHISKSNQKEQDTKTTIFVGNLPFNTDDEEVRKYFSKCGEIDYVRLIRDSRTHTGKGIAYIKFKDMQGFLWGLKLNMSKFRDRELRIKKA